MKIKRQTKETELDFKSRKLTHTDTCLVFGLHTRSRRTQVSSEDEENIFLKLVQNSENSRGCDISLLSDGRIIRNEL